VLERQLVKRVLEGDPVAQRQFYDTHVDRVYRLAFRITGDDESARECTQETFIKAFAKLGSFRGEAALSTWMHTVATSITLGWLRKTKRFDQREVNLETVDQTAMVGKAKEPMLDVAISGAINRLSDGYKTVVIMHDIEGYTHEEIGRALGIATGTSKVRLSRARVQLRGWLSDFAEEFAS
jgi:RNA polymerase sigma-70 factor (ECF subfamily)